MPQLILEISSNLLEKNNLHSLFQECHSILEKTLPTDVSSCKSRFIEHQNYYVGNGQANNAFAHVLLKIMPGRSATILENVGNAIMGVLKKHFADSLKKLNLQITMEIMELQTTYFKITSDSNIYTDSPLSFSPSKENL